MAEAQERKRRRQASHEQILHFVGMHGVPDASIVSIIDALRGEPELFYDIKSQEQVSRHIHEFLDTVAETTTLRLRDDEGHEEDCMWTYASTRKLLQHFVRECPSFAEMFFEALRASPNGPLSPWHLIFYVEETVIGAQLKKKKANFRKIHTFYASFRELGPQILCREDAWLPLGVLRSCKASMVVGNLSRVSRVLLNDVFGGVDCLSTAGVELDFPGLAMCWVTRRL